MDQPHVFEEEAKQVEPVKSVKWEKFLNAMHQKGFINETINEGTGVLFRHPEHDSPPITFHKPYPDSTSVLLPSMLKVFGQKLKKAFDWDEEDFYRMCGAV